MSHSTWSDIALADPQTIFDALLHHMEGDDLPVDRPVPHEARVEREGITLILRRLEAGLHVHVTDPDLSNLYFIREGAVAHVAAVDPVAALAVRWSGGEAIPTVAHRHPRNFRVGTVVSIADIMPDMIRVTLRVAGAAALGLGGLHVKLALPSSGRSPLWPTVSDNGTTCWPEGCDALTVRYYTIRHLEAASGTIDIDVVRHPGGAIAEWCDRACPGAKIGVLGPGGGGAPNATGDLLLAGDMTALPAIARILDGLTPGQRARAFVACPSQAAAEAYCTGHSVTALQPATFHGDLLAALADMPAPDAAWFAGEFDTAQALRRVFTHDWALSRDRQMSIAYWRRGRSRAAD